MSEFNDKQKKIKMQMDRVSRSLQVAEKRQEGFNSKTSELTKLRVANQIQNYRDKLGHLSGRLEQAGKKTTSFTDRLSKGFQKAQNSVGSSVRRIGEFFIGGILVNSFQNALSQMGQFVNGSVSMMADYEKAMTTLEIVAPRFNVPAQKAQKIAKDLGKELRIGPVASAESLQNLLKTGLNLDQAQDLMRRFTNEAMTGKSANISLSEAVQNLSFAYQTNNSAIGNLSGISENFSNITENGLKSLQKQGKLLGKTVGTLSDAEKEQAKYTGMIELTNLTMGSSAKFQGTYIDLSARISYVLEEMQRKLGGLIQKGLRPLQLAFLAVFESGGGTAGIFNKINSAVKTLQNNLLFQHLLLRINQGFQLISDTFQTLVNQFNKYLPKIINFFNQLGISTGDLDAVLVGLGAVFALVFGSLAVSLLGTLITMIGGLVVSMAPFIGRVLAVGLAWKAIQDRFGSVQNAINSLVSYIQTNFQPEIQTLTAGVQMLQTIWDSLVSSFMTYLLPALAVVGATLMWIASNVLVALKYAWEVLREPVNQFLQALFPLISTIAEILIPIISFLAGAFLVLVGVVASSLMPVFQVLWGVVVQVFSGILQIVTGVINVITGILNVFIGVVEGIMTGDFSRVSQGFSMIWQGLVGMVQGVAQSLFGIVRGIVDGIANTFASIDLFQVGMNIIQGLIDGLTSMMGNLLGKANEIADGVKETISGALQIASPSKVMEQLGKWTGEGLAVGIDNSKAEVASASAGMASAAVAPVAQTTNNTANQTNNINVSGMTVDQIKKLIQSYSTKNVNRIRAGGNRAFA